jgi:hydroxymethylpyrimidine/phosphomethylpyrimidine kinase
MNKYPVVLSIAGSDSSGGAGIQADIKTISALGCFATTAITAVTVQNTLGVSGIHPIPVEIVRSQIKAVMDDIQPSAIKIGMVHHPEIAITIASVLKKYRDVFIVFDPVMVATSGDHLIESNTIETLKKELFPLAQLITPNLDEAYMLTGITIHTIADMRACAQEIIDSGCNAVLVKGGHLRGSVLYDVFLNKNGDECIFKSTAIDTLNTHGTGCSLSSAIASYLALGNDLVTSIARSARYVQHAIKHGKDVKIGKGHGPLNHFFNPQKLVIKEYE